MTSEDEAKGEDAVRRTLARLQSVQGLVIASLVEPGSAQVLETVVSGPTAEAPFTSVDTAATTVAAAAGDVVQVIGLMMASLGDPDELEDVIITLGRRHHLITPVPAAGSDGLLIVLTLDRDRTNLAMARQQLRALGPLLEAATTPSHVS